MIKHHLIKLLFGLSIILALLGGFALGASATGAAAAHAAPAHRLLACGATPLPPCF